MKWLLAVALLLGGASLALAETSVTLEWTDPPPSSTSAAPTGHKLYRSTDTAVCNGTAPLPATPHRVIETMTNAYTETVTQASGKVCYEITAFNAGGESPRSNRAAKDLLPNPPQAPTLVIR